MVESPRPAPVSTFVAPTSVWPLWHQHLQILGSGKDLEIDGKDVIIVDIIYIYLYIYLYINIRIYIRLYECVCVSYMCVCTGMCTLDDILKLV